MPPAPPLADLLALREALTAPGAPLPQDAWALVDEIDLARLPAELHPLLAEICRLGAAHGRPLPAWRDRVRERALRTLWLRAEIAADPAALAADPLPDEMLCSLAGVGPDTLVHPEETLITAARAAHAGVRRWALEATRRALRAGWLLPEPAHAVLLALTEPSAPRDGGAYHGALVELSEPWTRSLETPASHLAPGISGPVPTARAAIDALLHHGHAAMVEHAVNRPDIAPSVVAHAVAALGEAVSPEKIPWILELARGPLELQDAVLASLEAALARGMYVQRPQLPALVALALRGPLVPPARIAALLDPFAPEVASLLAELRTDDPAWLRAVGILEALAHPAADEQLIALASTAPPAVRRAAIRALGRAADASRAEAEQAVLAQLLDHPGPALDALATLGGEPTRRALWAALGLDDGRLHPSLAPVRAEATTLLWRLIPDDEDAREQLLARLSPAELPEGIRRDLGRRPVPAEIELLALYSVRRRGLGPREALVALCTIGSAAVIPDLVRIVGHHADHLVSGPAHTVQGAIDPEVIGALRALGQRLEERGCIRPVLAAPDAILAHVVLSALAEHPMPDAVRAQLLEALDGAAVTIPEPALRPFLASNHPRLRRIAVRLTAQQAARDPSRSRTRVRLARLIAADDIQTARAAVEAAADLGLRSAEPAIAAVLDHPNMNLKRCAARALSVVGSARSVQKLLDWLGRHDNQGFRSDLLTALDAILGDTRRATVIAERDRSTTPRRRELLDALIRGGEPAPPPPRRPEPEIDALSIDEARLADRAWMLHHLPTLLLRLRRPGPHQQTAHLAAAIAALGVPQEAPEPVRRAWADDLPALAAQMEPTVPARQGLLAALAAEGGALPLEARLSLIGTVRRLPRGPTGRARWDALRALDAVPLEADLVATASDCAGSPQGERVLRALLAELFPAPADPAEAETLASQIRAAAAAPSPERLAPLLDRHPLGSSPLPPEPPLPHADRSLDDALETWRERVAAGRLAELPDGWDRLPELGPEVLAAWLDGQIPDTASTRSHLAAALDTLGFPAPETLDDAQTKRLLRLLEAGSPPLSLLLALRERGVQPERVEHLIRRGNADAWVPDALRAARRGDPSVAAVLRGELARTEASEALVEALATIAPELATSLESRLVCGTLLPPSTAPTEREAIRALVRSERTPERQQEDVEASPSELLATLTARRPAPKAARRALIALAARPVPEALPVVEAMVRDGEPSLRLAAHRCLRAIAPRETYLAATRSLLDDPRAEVRTSALRSLGHGRDLEAIPLMIAAMTDPHPAVRHAAADALVALGPDARRALERARRRARPDRQWRYTEAIEALDEGTWR